MIFIYPEKEYASLFQQTENVCGFRNGIGGYRVKTIRSGPFIEAEVFPIWNTRAIAGRCARAAKSRAAQMRLNERNSIKRLSRLLNANFTDKDIWLTLTYDDEHLPDSEERAYRDTVNYIRRLRRLSAEPLKYIIVTETHTEDGDPVRVHHHIVVNFRDRDKAEALWTKGGRTQSRRLQPDEYGFTGLANYLGKQNRRSESEKKITRRWRGSKNLSKPKITTADHKIGKRVSERLSKVSEGERKQYFERLYPKASYIDCTIRYSDIVAGVYIYVRMKRTE